MKLNFNIMDLKSRVMGFCKRALLNVKSDERVLSVRRSGVLWLVVLLIVLSGVAWYMMFSFTPMKYMLPARMDTEMRDDYLRLALRVDSLADMADINSSYLNGLGIIFRDSIPVAEADTAATNLYDLPLDSLMAAGKAEERFVRQFESSERFNLSVLSPIAAEGMVFYPPVSGVSLKSNATDKDMPAVTVNAATATPVSSVYRGTVIDAYYTSTKGITVVVQHPNNFISQYSGLGDIFVARGGKVNAGQRIGMSADERYPLTFMLWHDGTPLDPADYIQMPDNNPVLESEAFIKVRGRR